ncbi:chemotaxis protein CheW, partial [Patescibacteria group bacterium]|nr:chemotaxis protein CheW [Patescibacteria group bacterium]
PKIEEPKIEEPKIEEPKIEDKDIDNQKTIKTKTGTGRDEIDDSVKKIEYIKVPIKRLDALMDLVEELVIDKMALQRMGLKNKELQEVTDHVGLLIQSLQYEVMQARLVPVEQVFARFPRMVRDLSKRQEKKVEFFVHGSDLELDRSIVDKLGEPLVHLLRNAIDHGIKTEGYVRLEAKRDRENALIIVENNDQSIDIEKVKQAAVKRGIASAKEVDLMTNQEVMNLLFHPKLSTNDVVTEISGRGVGLNVVKSFAESSGGRVIVENLNPGARFTLELPLTLAIINSLLVEVGELIYAIPFSNIDRSVLVNAENIKRMADNNVAIVDGIKVPLIDLREKFGNIIVVDNNHVIEKSEKADDEVLKNVDKVVVIVKKGDELIGLVIDKLVGEQEVTVKPLSPILRNVRGFSGSTILGDGRTILILDIVNLLLTNFKK